MLINLSLMWYKRATLFVSLHFSRSFGTAIVLQCTTSFIRPIPLLLLQSQSFTSLCTTLLCTAHSDFKTILFSLSVSLRSLLTIKWSSPSSLTSVSSLTPFSPVTLWQLVRASKPSTHPLTTVLWPCNCRTMRVPPSDDWKLYRISRCIKVKRRRRSRILSYFIVKATHSHSLSHTLQQSV